VSARAATYPDLRLQALSHELRDGTRGLDAVGRRWIPAATCARCSPGPTCALRRPRRGCFRLLGLHPGATISVAAAASLVGQPIPAVRRLLTELVQTHLIVEQAAGRYGFHDLLRAYAIERAHEAEAPDVAREAGRRLLDHYLHGAHAAARAVQPQRDQIAISDPLPGVVGPEFTHHDEAFAWFVDEHSSVCWQRSI
jgi:hypothetical protein